MKREQILARLGEIGDELEKLDVDTLDEQSSTRFDALTAEADELRAAQVVIEERDAKRTAVRATVEQATGRATEGPGDGINRHFNVNTRTSADPFSLDELRFDTTGAELRARATSAIEVAVGDLSDDHRRSATDLIRRSDDGRGTLAKRILATGSPAYRSAFQKVAAGHGNLLDQDERAALVRAQSLTDSAGGFAIPFTLDPTIIMTNDGAANPFRQVSRVETIVTDTWNGVTSAGVSGGYAAEGSEVGDDAATLAQPSVKPERWDVFVPFSFEIGQDWANLENDVRMMVAEKRDEFDVVAFTTGTGGDEPFGIVTGLDGTASEVAPVTGETFAAADVYKLHRALPPKYRRTADQASFMGELGTYNTIRQFDTAGGSAFWASLGAGQPERLLGYRAYENSALDSAVDINPAVTADNHILILGDWRNYLIVDRAGMNMELVPHLFAAANNRPSGQRGFLAWGRTGAKVLNINAFVTLNVATTV